MSNSTQKSITSKSGIGALKLKSAVGGPNAKSPAPANDLSQVPIAATVVTVPSEGGKGGAAPSPSLPPSNSAFLTALFGDLPSDATPAICSKRGDPSDGGWPAAAADDVDSQCPADQNNYYNCSSFTTDDAGRVQAQKHSVHAFHVLVLDDVGTKASRRPDTFRPTYEIETSPGNWQVGYRLSSPIHDLAEVKRLQDAVIAAGLSDKGAAGAARWARLPVAINGKEKHRDEDGLPFACRLTAWHPEVAYSPAEIVAGLGLTLASPLASKVDTSPLAVRRRDEPAADDVWFAAPAENPVVTALKARGLYKHEIAPGKHDVTCPWVTEHTDGLDHGSAYFEPDATHPVGGYKCQHSHGDRYRIGELMRELEVNPELARGKARIRLVAGELNRIRQASEMALLASGGFYQSGGAIVSVRTDPVTGDVSIELLSEPALTAALADAADWERYDKGEKRWVRTDPPPRNVQVLFKASEYTYLPPLKGLTRQPFLREADRSLVTVPGYDPVSQRFAAFDPAAYPMPEPTEEAARLALSDLQSLLSEFRLASEEDRSAAICAMLTAAVRPALSVAPAFNITASSPGSGKSYLASVITPIAGPGTPLKMSYPSEGAEASKAMLAALLPGPAVILFDDMQSQWLPHSVMNRMLTSDTISDRVLGHSRTLTVGTRTLILGTGNNVGPIRDMNRRVVTIRLQHHVAAPALERYSNRPAEAVAANRGRYVAAALTIVAAWLRAGSPRADVPALATYEAWSDLCRQPLLWLGLPDPAASTINQLRHDPDQDLLGSFLKAWHAEIGERAITLRDLLTAAEDKELGEIILDLPVTDRDVINRTKLGYYLKHNANRVVDGLVLQDGDLSTRKSWRVVRLEGGEGGQPQPPLPPLP